MASERELLLSRLSEAVRRDQLAATAVSEAANQLLGINITDGQCLDILARHGPLSAGELAREARLTTGGLTAVIDRLERAGYARRVADPADRRRVLVQITERANELSWELFGPLVSASGPLLERYTDKQLELLEEFHRTAAGMQEQHADWLRHRGRPTKEQSPENPAKEQSPENPAREQSRSPS